MVIVNLKHIADIPDRVCSREELAIVLETAEEILASTPEDVLMEIMAEWETALIWAHPAQATEEWYWRALLLTCCRGLLGLHRPKFACFYRDC